MPTAFVTGATGFVGSHLTRRLLRDGWKVHLLCRSTSNFWRIAELLPAVHRHQGSLEDRETLKTIVTSARPDVVFHLASATVVAGAAPQGSELVAGNLLGTVNLIDACEAVDYRAMILTGDSFEYACSREPLRESDACRPDTLHGITKLAALLYGQAMARAQRRPIVGLRLFSTYGPHDNPRRLVPRMIENALKAEPLLLSRPEISRDWVYIDDVIDLYLEASREASRLAGGVFNAGSGVETRIENVVNMILALTGSRSQPSWGRFQAPPHDEFPWIANMEHTFANLNWRPRTSLADGLRATIAALLPGA